MKYNILFAICFCMVAVSFSSCKKFLDIRPKKVLIPSTLAEYESMLNGLDLNEGSDYFPAYMTDDAYLPDKTQGSVLGLNSVSVISRSYYTFAPVVYGESDVDFLWEGSYARIYYYNVLDKKVPTATQATEAEKQAVRAEALLGRAFEYLSLVTAYAPVYNTQTAATDKGVPLLLDDNINQTNLTRASVKEVYGQILADLTEAEKNLPAKPKINAFRGSLLGCYGLMARTYLYMGNYAEALKYANKLLGLNNFLLDLKQYRIVNPTQTFGRNNVPLNTSNAENLYLRFPTKSIGVSGSVFGSQDLLSMFGANDQRLLLYFTKTPYGIPSAFIAWFPYLDVNVAVSTPEIYLIAAECEARVGSKEKALELVNHLRNYRINNNAPLTAASNDEALKIVLDERRRELAFIGCMRLLDLKRLNKEPRFAKTITHITESGTTYTLPPNDPRYILQIPLRIQKFNPNMPINER